MTRRLCIAHGGDLSAPSGGTDRVTALAAGLRERDHEVMLVVPEPAAALPERLDGVDVVTADTGDALSNSLRRGLEVVRTARRVSEERSARLQIEHSTLAGLATLAGVDGFVLDMHDLANARFEHVGGPLSPVYRRSVAWLERRAVRKADHVVAVSGRMRTYLVERWGCDPDAVTVVPNGYFPERIQTVRDTDRVPGRVCFLGTLHPKVDIATIGNIAALSGVSEAVVVGDGAQRDGLERLANRHDTLRVTGRLPDAEAFELLASAAVAINPQEPSALQRLSSPVKLYYYAALGCPMVVTAGPSVVGELVEADAAVTAPAGDSFVEAVRALLADAGRAERLGANARREAERFAWARRVDMLTSLYSNSLGTDG